MKPLYLIGFMGSGKSTVGKALGERWKLAVYDTDDEIVKKENKSINQIFEQIGEAGFRKLETEMLSSLPISDCIIMTGGGIILKEENIEIMKENGVVILLEATIDEILKRLEKDETRPLLKGEKKQNAMELFENRKAQYLAAADMTIQTTSKSVEEIIQEIEKRLNL
ncbi:shikimate kinase [Bacillus massilinigeriensis]|uniref:shikimate kinase n=1 Tax=Bacillus massilionigeriensis TaxID=1805475 RepID=UPI00096B17D7|nr:shikimate kinase [Bacillus massilionigeriensis]